MIFGNSVLGMFYRLNEVRHRVPMSLLLSMLLLISGASLLNLASSGQNVVVFIANRAFYFFFLGLEQHFIYFKDVFVSSCFGPRFGCV